MLNLAAFPQDNGYLKNRTIKADSLSLRLDSLTLIPQSVIIYDSTGSVIPVSAYKINLDNSTITFSDSMYKGQNLNIVYRTFPYNFNKPYFKKSTALLQENKPGTSKKNIYTASGSYQPLAKDMLEKQGSISRGVTFGNNQDVIVNSNLNLQLSGKITDDLNILAAISDNNIPIQPDGNTQQIQDFDKVFVSLFNDKYKLTVGDFEVSKPYGYFLNMNKKVQGGMFSVVSGIDENNKNVLRSSVGGAVSKGKYCRMELASSEGNQGPYKIRGCDNEMYIVVLSGSEKVYIDGKLLMRGQENDYVMDYNAAELTFTPNQPITKDKRIVIEFEYSDKNYARFTVMNTNRLNFGKKGTAWLNIYSETDSKNQTLQQDLTDEQKQLLSNIGDSIQQAFVPNIDSVAFDNGMVLYSKFDSLVDGTLYKNVYVYSINPDSARFRLGFSYVGKNNGNYTQIKSSANGKVYKWLAPVDGVKQGSYEPVVLLITPKKKQMATAGFKAEIVPTLMANVEIAVSENDINTFSDYNSSDDAGYAIKCELTKKFRTADSTKTDFQTGIRYEFKQKYFSPVERYRPVEFERDWNIVNRNLAENEQLINYNILYDVRKKGMIRYDAAYLNSGNTFSGIRNSLAANATWMGFNLTSNGSILNATDTANSSVFIRHTATLSKQLHLVKIGVAEEQEINRWNTNIKDSLMQNSFAFKQYSAFISLPDSVKNKFNITYKFRNDYIPLNNEMVLNTTAKDLNAGMEILKSKTQSFKTVLNYRVLEYNDSLQDKMPENTITGRLEHSLRVKKGFITTSTFYEVGSGLELKKEFSYLEVAQGQGVYSWSDYNGNGIKELDEFEVAAFQDQANYIRVYTPTNETVKVYTNQFNEVLQLTPEKIWNGKKGIKKFISLFSNQTAYRVSRKISDNDPLRIFNPIEIKSLNGNESDSTLISISSSLRNTFSFNKTSSKFGADYMVQSYKNKTLLVNGFDTKTSFSQGIKARWNIARTVSFENYVQLGNKVYNSEYFSSKNYTINFLENDFQVSYQPQNVYRISLAYNYKNKENTESIQKSESHDIGTEIRYNAQKNGNFSLKINYINISYNDSPNSAVAYEMLEGLLPGNNYTWTLLYQRNLTNSLQMNLNYSGRKSMDAKTVHTGGVQLRAFF